MLVRVGRLRSSKPGGGLVLPNLLRNSSLVGANAGPPDVLPTYWTMTSPINGVTRDITATGTDVQTYMDVNWAGTGSSTSGVTAVQFDNNTAIPTVEGERRCGSLWLSSSAMANVSGLKLRLRYNTSGGVLLAFTETNMLAVTSTPTRYSVAGGAAPATTAYVVMQIIANWALAAVDMTLRVQGPMVNSGDVPATYAGTSP